MEEEQLLLDYRFEVEEDRPTAGISNKIRSQTSIEALNRPFILD